MAARPIEDQPWWEKVKQHRFIRLGLYSALALLLFLALVPSLLQEELDVEAGGIAPQDVRSPVTVENTEETERLRQEAIDSVDPVYSINPRYTENQIQRLREVFQLVRLINLEVREQNGDLTTYTEEPEAAEGDPWTDEEQLEELRSRLAPEMAESLTDDTLFTLLSSSQEELETAEETTASAVADVMSDEVSLDEVEEARTQVENRVRQASVRSSLEEAMVDLSRNGITANYMIDDEATADARRAAAEMVEPSVVREGQLIAEEGQVITSEMYEQMRLAGLTDDTTTLTPLVGLGIITSLMVFVLARYFYLAKTTVRENNTHLLLLVLIFTLTIFLMFLTSLIQPLGIPGVTYLVPAAVGTLLSGMLLQARIGVFLSFLFAISAGLMFNQESTSVMDYTHAVYVFFSGLAGVLFLNPTNRLAHMLQTGTWIAGINAVVITAMNVLKGMPLTAVELPMYAGFAFAGGYISIILAVGLLPFFEAGFGILSRSRLIELSNPNHPLLRKILLEAPGTYHHSVVVANLAEAACEAIGADGLLARVGAYYHDAGKTLRPQYFIENQVRMENPHDRLAPRTSAEIIIAHPYDGAEMLRKARLPKEIIDIAEQHHGTTLLKYFYFKAKEHSSSVEEMEYRYPGPRARFKESAVVGIADSVEAAVRSMESPTQEKIESLVRKIMNDRLEDGQFDECDITLKELSQVYGSICETLKGTFHSRIDYPEEKPLKPAEGE